MAELCNFENTFDLNYEIDKIWENLLQAHKISEIL